MQNENDAEILGRSVDEPGEFAAIYNRHVGSILRYARRRLGETAGEDVTRPSQRRSIPSPGRPWTRPRA
jgi:RNA polymerase sigma-70 factor (ECF subfamily)